MGKITDGGMCSKYETVKVMTILKWTEIVIAQTLFSLEKQVPCIWGEHKIWVFFMRTVCVLFILNSLHYVKASALELKFFTTNWKFCDMVESVLYIYFYTHIYI